MNNYYYNENKKIINYEFDNPNTVKIPDFLDFNKIKLIAIIFNNFNIKLFYTKLN